MVVNLNNFMFYFNARDIEDLDVVQFKQDVTVSTQDRIYFDYEPVGLNSYATRKVTKIRHRRRSNKK